MRNIQAFGAKNAFFEEDRILLMDWCQAILFVSNQFEQRKKAAKASCQDTLWNDENLNCVGVPVFDDFEEIKPCDHIRFHELATLCDKILRKLDLGEGAYDSFKKKINAINQEFYLAEKQRIQFESEMRRIKAEKEAREKEELKNKRKQELKEKADKRKRDKAKKGGLKSPPGEEDEIII